MACQRNNIPKQEHEVVLKYLELIPMECALWLEDPIRTPPEGWRLGPLMREAETYYELRRVYQATPTGGLHRQREQIAQQGVAETQRATWANDRKMMQTPLRCSPGLQAPPDPLKGVSPQSGKGLPNQCATCGGTDGHGKKNCLNEAAKNGSRVGEED